MAEFPLLPIPIPVPDRRPRGSRRGRGPRFPTRARQGERLQPAFERLRNVLDADRDPLTLRDDPAAIAPERALVLEIAGTIDDFQGAARRIAGLEYLADEETAFDADADFAEFDTRKGREDRDRTDKQVVGRVYLAMPDTRALQQLVSLWDRYQGGEQAPEGFAPWFHLFDSLRQLRAWGPVDRVPEDTIDWLAERLDARTDPLRVEIELWSYAGVERRRQSAQRFEEAVRASRGEILKAMPLRRTCFSSTCRSAMRNVPSPDP